mmetsp:Transcript_40915/g.127451  ORF Transcript_40915/g.127451 Transcript_40915/m.127451 type:complete len:380 (+) Transcript_40915:750-1889(+)
MSLRHGCHGRSRPLLHRGCRHRDNLAAGGQVQLARRAPHQLLRQQQASAAVSKPLPGPDGALLLVLALALVVLVVAELAVIPVHAAAAREEAATLAEAGHVRPGAHRGVKRTRRRLRGVLRVPQVLWHDFLPVIGVRVALLAVPLVFLLGAFNGEDLLLIGRRTFQLRNFARLHGRLEQLPRQGLLQRLRQHASRQRPRWTWWNSGRRARGIQRCITWRRFWSRRARGHTPRGHPRQRRRCDQRSLRGQLVLQSRGCNDSCGALAQEHPCGCERRRGGSNGRGRGRAGALRWQLRGHWWWHSTREHHRCVKAHARRGAGGCLQGKSRWPAHASRCSELRLAPLVLHAGGCEARWNIQEGVLDRQWHAIVRGTKQHGCRC